ncbi:S-Ena type endospore appendage [Pontibacillus litoralis]|uniref:Endospore appendages core domain-containing protein n=1 Tax=Pontibacillus litoralis JSM 072002 TaxID=1385512 RepID=A0A0A5HXB6_9BACI|nr:S-Ena type endospore appendage [Pontibacillus litoralis]KGX88267.1 hypothetical protein N784_10575 [Pontibacillus litoralis JSM 072002]
MSSCNTVCCPPCIGSGSTLNGAGDGAELIKVNLCQPLRNLCDGVTEGTIFFSGSIPAVDGLFTVSNSSADCTINLLVTDVNGDDIAYTIPPQSSVAIAVNDLTSITYTCTGPDPANFCTGAFEANLHYCVSC